MMKHVTYRNINFIWFAVAINLLSVSFLKAAITGSKCGCKTFSSCYIKMLETLKAQDEVNCIEDAAIGSSTVTVFIKALQTFCGEKFQVNYHPNLLTYDHRHLYEVVIHEPNKDDKENAKPIFIIDAGQEAGTESVGFALLLIEELVGCEENHDLIEQIKWVIMPSTNPDGMEYSRYQKNDWRKNLRVSEDEVSFGVDISRNFDINWSSCEKVESTFAPDYPGPSAASENETIFIKQVLEKYKSQAKIYLSIRRDGHHIAYPYAYNNAEAKNLKDLDMIAAEVALKVNQRNNGINVFMNDSIYNLQGKPHCGHSVDYAYNMGIPLSFQMRVFLENDNRIVAKFQKPPKGFETSLRNGYFSGVRELANVLINEKKYGKIARSQ